MKSLHLTVLMAYLKTNEEAKGGPPEVISAPLLSLSSTPTASENQSIIIKHRYFYGTWKFGIPRTPLIEACHQFIIRRIPLPGLIVVYVVVPGYWETCFLFFST